MKTISKLKITLLIVVSLSINSCTKDIDNVTNNNDPNAAQVLSTGSDLTSVIAGGFASWWQAGNRDTYPALAVAGDIATCSWGNYGMRTLSNEPRNSIPNSTSWSDASVLEQPWGGYYAAASGASDVIKAINKGVVYEVDGVDETNSILASAYFLRGISLGYLGLLFDKAIIIDENSIPTITQLSSYNEVITAAIADLDRARDLSSTNTFTLPSNFINGYALDNDKLIKLCNSYAARFIVQGARTQAETDAINWATVKTLAENGIQNDFGPIGDNGVNWWSNVVVLSSSPNGFEESGGRLDMRIVHLMDPTQPLFYPTTTNLDNLAITTTDNRINTDFDFDDQVYFRPARGKYHFSHYISKRYVTDPFFSDGSDTKRLVTFAKADNDLLLAEANARLDNLSDAITIVNNGTRVSRGNLAPIADSATKNQVLDAIFYERYVELFNTALGGGFFDRRRTNQLQKGTFRHFPVPASVLQVIGQDLYTFGGANNDPTGMVAHYNIENNPTRTDDTNLPTFN
ncbi:RagB/SusD family nutrient uptake outer membrane protein [Flavobacterium sp.]|uniref:RagB/SusD family nutrient uptake outer membrane protein n=1 Tax=Flavobacterium sp. TaxID=239 RepID=UPI002624F745|nr:RagB/SusD family nutrient uptake outer membrane protein [Flavobacterium sp.]